MNKRIFLSLALTGCLAAPAVAQRTMDVLDRGLVAVSTPGGVFCSWRINAEEWYGTAYNIYRDGTLLNSSPLQVSNFTDPDGSASSKYTVAPVVNGAEQQKCEAVAVLEKNYLLIEPKHDPSLTSTYVPNDACCADVDGDGVLEILMKYDNESEISASYPRDGHNGEYSLFECLKLDGTVLWWVNCGPNMGDFQNNEQNIVGYDWDRDGRAEVVFRAADGTTIHMADGTVYTVGDPSLNYRGATGGGANWFMHSGKEYLLYVDGLTGKPYQCIDYPLPRLEDSENPNGLLSGGAYDDLVNKAWGDGYGHRSTKHFFGAPYLDGRNPSIFIARGIYTRHKMIAYDVDPETHQLVERWRWNCSEPGAWYGQGYHNYSIADVDWDGRDEIVFGSMVIDDNGRGLSTTGLGHGDSHHVGDFDPYTHGQEVFACNEDNPNNNFRDATTSKIYYRTTGGNDDGRANMGNFIDEYPGAQGVTSRDPNLIGGASHAAIEGDNKGTVTITQNFRIFWDGDLCDESFDYNSGKNTQGAIFKAKGGRIALLEGSRTNNDTKGTPCYQGDIFGDWREEVMMRDGQNNIRIYTTDIPTPWRNYTLWHDPQYRNAMVWQMCGYNQTPHQSYFIGEYEGITLPPPPVTMTGRNEIANNATIGHDTDGKHIIMCETGDMQVDAVEGASPAVLTVNTPSWVQGNDDNNNITYRYFTHTIKSGKFAGGMRLTKQGDGTLVLPAEEHTYTGPTDVWAGALEMDGTLTNSPLWLNRFACLNTAGGNFAKGISMDYAAEMNIGSDASASSVSTSVLSLGFGAIVNLDLFSDGISADKIVAGKIAVERKDWKNGPQYLAPIIRLTGHPAEGEMELATGKYLIGEVAEVEGSLDDLILEGLDNMKKTLVYDADGKLYLDVQNFATGSKTWTGTESGVWDIDNTLNFNADGSDEGVAFYPGDEVTFDDNAEVTDIVISGNMMPASVTFDNNEKNYTLSGDGSIVGETSLVKNGNGKLTVNNINSYTGGTYINGGTLVASSFANSIGADYGALGNINNRIYIKNNAVLSTSANLTLGHRISLRGGHATIDVPQGLNLTLSNGITTPEIGQILYKTGKGTLDLATDNQISRLVIVEGAVNDSEKDNKIALPNIVEFINGALYDVSNIYSYSTNSTKFVVEEGNSGSLYLDARCDYTGKLEGAGRFSVYAASVRNYLKGDWSAFEGTVVAGLSKRGSSYDPEFLWENNYGLPKATLNVSANTTFNAGSRNLELGGLSGTGTVNTTGTITVGGNDAGFSCSTKFTGNPRLVKTGAGDWKIASAVTGIKNITVNDGIVSLAASNQKLSVVTVPMTIEGTALMRGRGTVNSLVVKGEAVLQPGTYSDTNTMHYGPLYVSTDLTVEDGAILALYIRKTENVNNACSYVDVTGKLTINGKVVVTLNEDCVPKVGDVIDLWNAGTFEGTPVIELPELPNGLYWDVTGLFDASGELKITDTEGISDIFADSAAFDGPVFDIMGRPVTPGYHGIIIVNGKKYYKK